MIVCIEGIDASGKATQASMLATRLGCGVIAFPDYQTASGQLIRDHLQGEWLASYHDPTDGRNQQVDAAAFQALMLTNRMEQAMKIESCRLHRQHLVLDRYWPSGVVYGGADGLDEEWLIQIHRYLPFAEHYLLLDIEPKTSVERRPDRQDRYELQPGLMDEAANRYRMLWSRMHDRDYPADWDVIDGNGRPEDVHARICQAIFGDS